MKPWFFQILPVLFITLITLLFFNREIFQNQIIWGPDSPKIFFPLTLVLSEWLKNLNFSLWTPYIHFGYPLSAEGQVGLLYPLNWLHFFFSPSTSINILSFLHLALSGVAAYFFGRTIKLSKLSSLLVAVSFMFSFRLIAYLQDLPKLYSYPYLPLALALIYKFFLAKKIIFLPLASVVLAMQILPGHPNVPLVSVLFSLLFLLYLSFKNQQNVLLFLRNCLILLGFYLLLILPRIVETLTLFTQSLRWGTLNFLELTNGSLSLFDLITFLFPHFYFLNTNTSWIFSPTFHFWTYWGVIETAIYIGIPTIILAVFGLKSSHPFKLFFIFSAIFFLLVSLGKNTPLYQNIFLKIPVLNGLRDPSRYMYLTNFSLIILAGFGLDKLIFAKKRSQAALFLFLLPLMLFFFLLGTVNWLSARNNQFLKFIYDYYLPLGPTDVAKVLPGFLGGLSPLKTETFRQLVIFFISCWLFALMFLTRRGRTFLGPLIVLLLTADMLINTQMINSHRPQDPLLHYPDDIGNLRVDMQKNNSRLYTFTNFWSDYLPDQLLPAKVMEANGFTGLPLRRFDRYQRAAETEWLTQKTGRLFALGSIEKIFGNREGQPKLVNNDYFLPRAYLVPNFIIENDEEKILVFLEKNSFNPFGQVVLEEQPKEEIASKTGFNGLVKISGFTDLENRVVITAENENPSLLVLTDTYYPGWQAEVDGQPTKIYQANYLFRALFLPAGTHTIEFKYQPRYLIPSIIISLLTLVIIVVLTVKSYVKKN